MAVFFFKQKTAYEMRISDWSSDVCSSDLVIFVVRRLGRGIALALFCNDMDQDQPFRRIPDILQHGEQVVQVMAVDRADIIEAKLLEQRAARRHSAREFIGLSLGDMQRARDPPGDLEQP